jgi:hypothetical protein
METKELKIIIIMTEQEIKQAFLKNETSYN